MQPRFAWSGCGVPPLPDSPSGVNSGCGESNSGLTLPGANHRAVGNRTPSSPTPRVCAAVTLQPADKRPFILRPLGLTPAYIYYYITARRDSILTENTFLCKLKTPAHQCGEGFNLTSPSSSPAAAGSLLGFGMPVNSFGRKSRWVPA